MLVLGVDYGTDSVRALIVCCKDGVEFGTGVVVYPSGSQGILPDQLDRNIARQNPADYLFDLKASVKLPIEQARQGPGFDLLAIVGIEPTIEQDLLAWHVHRNHGATAYYGQAQAGENC
ncbi:hypothetical protein ACQZ6V_14950 [Agrobacterium sp. 22-3674b3]|uniref:hypothetical protein n=1 Tax=Agrobacterium tumefaciens TaxID=358 RepID=UPI0028531C7E|nr:hypothetical protein [Agrobacterium tumefaciens]MDR5012159.1 hypothetical protein [Agrobacterium tumefaciens]